MYKQNRIVSIFFYLAMLVSLVSLMSLMSVSAAAAGDAVALEGHPKLTLTQDGVQKIRSALGTVPLFDATLAKVKAEVDAEIEAGIDTPVPKGLFRWLYAPAAQKQFLRYAKSRGSVSDSRR